MRFTISGVPIAKARPRFSCRGGFARAYDIQEKEKNAVISEVTDIVRQALDSDRKQNAIDASNLASAEFYDVTLVFHQPVPKSCTDAERNAKLWGFEKCTTKPDLDNLQKFYLDCFIQQLYSDDRFVVTLKSAKSYTRNPRIEVNIMPGKADICPDAKELLKIYGPDSLEKLIRSVEKLKELFGTSDIENVDDERLKKTAYILSDIADNNYALFTKIHKKHPGFYKLAERMVEQQQVQGQNV